MNQKIKQYEDIYELWYEWLKTTDPKDWTQLMRDTLLPLGEKFDEWWEECSHHFLPAIETEAMWKLENAEEAAWYLKEGYPVIAINDYSPADHVIREVRKMLQSLATARSRGRPAYTDDGDLFDLHQRPDAPTLQALSKMLAVYKEWKAGTRPMWALGEKLGLNPSSQSEEPKRAMTATVSRYLKWSDTLRKNIVKGHRKQFPKYK